MSTFVITRPTQMLTTNQVSNLNAQYGKGHWHREVMPQGGWTNEARHEIVRDVKLSNSVVVFATVEDLLMRALIIAGVPVGMFPECGN